MFALRFAYRSQTFYTVTYTQVKWVCWLNTNTDATVLGTIQDMAVDP